MARRQAVAVAGNRWVTVRQRTVVLIDRRMALRQGGDHGRRRERQQNYRESPHRQSSFVRVTPTEAGSPPGSLA
jgi:hypothetical protein